MLPILPAYVLITWPKGISRNSTSTKIFISFPASVQVTARNILANSHGSQFQYQNWRKGGIFPSLSVGIRPINTLSFWTPLLLAFPLIHIFPGTCSYKSPPGKMDSRQKSSPRVKWTVAHVAVMGFLAALVTQSACTPVLPDGASAVGPPYMTDNGEANFAPGTIGDNVGGEVYLTPLFLRQLLTLSRLHQEEANAKRSHYKQCAFNAVSCFG